jgi:hypothetical protein
MKGPGAAPATRGRRSFGPARPSGNVSREMDRQAGERWPRLGVLLVEREAVEVVVKSLFGVARRPIAAHEPSGHFPLAHVAQRRLRAVLSPPEERDSVVVDRVEELEQRLIDDLWQKCP